MSIISWRTVLVGVCSTLTMDLLSGIAYRLRLTAPLSPHLIARWFVSVARAQPYHAHIARASAVNHELAIALPVHHAIGAALTSVYLWAMSELGWPKGNLVVALAFGLCTSALPWLLMFPSMGYGWFGAHGPAGTRLFVSSLWSHAFFGVGIWLAVKIVSLA
jgi:Protein of unknown function (DUF2938)